MKNSDARAVALLIGEHRARLLQIAEKRLPARLRSRLDAEDVLQQTFERATRKYHRLAEEKAPEFAWIYRILIDCISEEWVRATREIRDVRADIELPADSCSAFLPVDSGTGPVSAAARNELVAAVPLVLGELSSSYRDVLLMRVVDQLKFKEIAAVLKTSEVNATQRYRRALVAFKKDWKRRFPEPE